MVHQFVDPCRGEYLWYKGHANLQEWSRKKIVPFKSEKQRRYLWKNNPEIAKKWTKKYKTKPIAKKKKISKKKK